VHFKLSLAAEDTGQGTSVGVVFTAHLREREPTILNAPDPTDALILIKTCNKKDTFLWLLLTAFNDTL
jgi:hypothetical protein